MFGLKYVKISPTDYVILYKAGNVVRKGSGLSFFYFAPNSTLVLIPAGSTGVPFVFDEVTNDFQDVTIQGELTFRLTDPEKIGSLLDYSVNGNLRYQSDDPAKLNERLIHATQILARSFTQSHSLRETLVQSNQLVEHLRAGLQKSNVLASHGVELLDLALVSLKPSPEMGKALQAEAREQLLRESDEAMNERRNAAVEMERKIKENELQTEIAVEQKRRQIEEKKMEAAIAVEQKRSELVEKKVENERREAAARGDALKAVLEPLKDIDWRTLLAAGGMTSEDMIAMAFRDLADNAEKIGQLNISPDLLDTLMRNKNPDTPPNKQQKRRN